MKGAIVLAFYTVAKYGSRLNPVTFFMFRMSSAYLIDLESHLTENGSFQRNYSQPLVIAVTV